MVALQLPCSRGVCGCCTVFFLVVAFAFLYAGPWNSLLFGNKGGGPIWKDCSKPNGAVKIIKVDIVPNPPSQGKLMTVSAGIVLTKNITDGTLKVSAKYGIIPVYGKTLDLCSLMMKKLGQPCPVRAGTYKNTTRATLPGALPGGHYSGTAIATDKNGDELFCIKFDLYL